MIQADSTGKDTAAKIAKLEFEMIINSAEATRDRMPKEIFYIPAILSLSLVWALQRRRRSGLSAQLSTASRGTRNVR